MIKLLIMSDFLSPGNIIPQLGISKDDHISDFGCGSGHMTLGLSSAVGEDGVVNAIDIQTAPLEVVRSKAESLGIKNIKTIHADLEVQRGTGIEDSSQNLVFISQALFQSQKKQEIIKEAYRILKIGGSLAMIEWKKGAGGLGPPDDLRSSEDELRRIVEGVGFVFDGTIETDQFHVGLKFKKQ